MPSTSRALATAASSAPASQPPEIPPGRSETTEIVRESREHHPVENPQVQPVRAEHDHAKWIERGKRFTTGPPHEWSVHRQTLRPDRQMPGAPGKLELSTEQVFRCLLGIGELEQRSIRIAHRHRLFVIPEPRVDADGGAQLSPLVKSRND